MKRTAIVLGTLAFAGALVSALLALPPAPVSLPPAVAAKMDVSGVSHPVTAVLLNFRGYDTLLEVAVLLLALLGVLAIGREDRIVRGRHVERIEPVVAMLARLGVPLMLLVGIYLLWAGAHRPGGAFQAAAVIAAAAVLLNLARLTPAWTQAPGVRLRWGLTGGLLVFAGIAAMLLTGGTLLAFPPARAGLLILVIESALTVSLGLILAGLFLFLSEDRGGRP